MGNERDAFRKRLDSGFFCQSHLPSLDLWFTLDCNPSLEFIRQQASWHSPIAKRDDRDLSLQEVLLIAQILVEL